MALGPNYVPAYAPQDQIEQLRIQRARDMAAALQAQSMQEIQPQQTGRFAVPISPFQGAAKMLQAGLAGWGQGKADERQMALANALRGRTRAAMEEIGRGPQQNAPGGILAPQNPGAVTQQPQPFQEAPQEGPDVRALPQQQPVIPDEQMRPGLESMHQIPLEPNKPYFVPNQEPMPGDVVPPTEILGGGKPKTESAAEFAQRVRIIADRFQVDPFQIMQMPEIGGKYQQLLELEKESRGEERDMRKLYTQDEIARAQEKFKRGLSADDIVGREKGPSGEVFGFTRGGQSRPLGSLGPDMNQLMIPDGKGGWKVNEQLAGARKEIGAASRPSIDVKVDTAGNSEVAKKVADVAGKRIDTTMSAAQGSSNLIGTIHGIRDALDSGKVIMGPGATVRQYIGQIGQTLGVTGKNEAETLANTRKAMQGLAQSELDTAQQMKGQGQITEAERAIIRRAALGNIESMTEPELRLLLDTMEKTSRFKIQFHNKMIDDTVKGKPGMDLSAPMLRVEEPGPYQKRVPERPAAPTQGGGWSIKRIE